MQIGGLSKRFINKMRINKSANSSQARQAFESFPDSPSLSRRLCVPCTLYYWSCIKETLSTRNLTQLKLNVRTQWFIIM